MSIDALNAKNSNNIYIEIDRHTVDIRQLTKLNNYYEKCSTTFIYQLMSNDLTNCIYKIIFTRVCA